MFPEINFGQSQTPHTQFSLSHWDGSNSKPCLKISPTAVRINRWTEQPGRLQTSHLSLSFQHGHQQNRMLQETLGNFVPELRGSSTNLYGLGTWKDSGVVVEGVHPENWLEFSPRTSSTLAGRQHLSQHMGADQQVQLNAWFLRVFIFLRSWGWTTEPCTYF